jgi:hypothetical protein
MAKGIKLIGHPGVSDQYRKHPVITNAINPEIKFFMFYFFLSSGTILPSTTL